MTNKNLGEIECPRCKKVGNFVKAHLESKLGTEEIKQFIVWISGKDKVMNTYVCTKCGNVIFDIDI